MQLFASTIFDLTLLLTFRPSTKIIGSKRLIHDVKDGY